MPLNYGDDVCWPVWGSAFDEAKDAVRDEAVALEDLHEVASDDFVDCYRSCAVEVFWERRYVAEFEEGWSFPR